MSCRQFKDQAQINTAKVCVNRQVDRIKVLAYDGAGMGMCTYRLQDGAFYWPAQAGERLELTLDQFQWLVDAMPWQRQGRGVPKSITYV